MSERNQMGKKDTFTRYFIVWSLPPLHPCSQIKPCQCIISSTEHGGDGEEPWSFSPRSTDGTEKGDGPAAEKDNDGHSEDFHTNYFYISQMVCFFCSPFVNYFLFWKCFIATAGDGHCAKVPPVHAILKRRWRVLVSSGTRNTLKFLILLLVFSWADLFEHSMNLFQFIYRIICSVYQFCIY